MLYHTLTENQCLSHVPIHIQKHNTKVYGRGAYLRKVLYIRLKLSFENNSYIILKLNIQNAKYEKPFGEVATDFILCH